MERLICAARTEGTRVVRILALSLIAIFCGTSTARAQTGWHLDRVAVWGGPINAVQAEGDIAYVGRGKRLVVLNVADPANPFEIGSILLRGTINDIALRGGYAYVAGGGLRVLDVSDPTMPRLVWAGSVGASEVDLHGDTAYVVHGIDLDVLDITNPENPVLLGRVIEHNVTEVVIEGDRMYVAARQDEFGRGYMPIFDLSGPDPVNPPLLGSVVFFAEREVQQIVVDGDRAYALVWDIFAGADKQLLWVMDVADPAAPTRIGSVEVTNRHTRHGAIATDLDISGGMVYVADWAGTPGPSSEGPGHGMWERSQGLAVYDVATDPSAPVKVGAFKTHGAIRGVKTVGDRAYVFDEGEGLIITDIGADPAHPARLGMYYSPAVLRQMAKDGDLLYITDAWNGFTILDVSDPLTPVLVGIYQTPGIDGTPATGGLQDHWGIEIRDGLAFLAAGYGGIQVVDISSPTNPVLWTSYPFPLCIKSVALTLNGNVAHVGTTTCTGGGFFVNFDISSLPDLVDTGSVFVGLPPTKIERSQVSEMDTFVARAVTSQFTTPTIRSPKVGDPFCVAETPPSSHDLATLDASTVCMAAFSSDAELGGLYVMDASDPSEGLAYVSHVSFRFAGSVAAQNGRAYIVGTADAFGLSSTSRTMVFSLTDRVSPRPIAKSPFGAMNTSFSEILADEPYVYIAVGQLGNYRNDDGLTILKLTCPVDFNADERVNTLDFIAFLSAFSDGAPEADFNGDGTVNTMDFLAFLREFNMGCP